MTYLVIKNINGRSYIYEQETYRLGKKVYTRSKYICPANNMGINTLRGGIQSKVAAIADQDVKGILQKEGFSTRNKIKNVFEEGVAAKAKNSSQSSDDIGMINAPENKTSQDKHKINNSSNPDKTVLKNSINLKWYNISFPALEKFHLKSMANLKRIGIDTAQCGKIDLRYGTKTRFRRASFLRKKISKTDYVVTLPRGERGNSAKFRQSYYRAVSQSTLDLIEDQNPAMYDKIFATFDKSFQRSQNALCNYICHTSNPLAPFQALSLRVFGSASYLKKYRKKYKLDPMKIGRSSFDEDIKSWEDQFSSIMTIIQKEGFGKALEKREKMHQALAVQERKEFKSYLKAQKTRKKTTVAWKRYQRTLAKRQIQYELITQMKNLNSIFQWDINTTTTNKEK